MLDSIVIINREHKDIKRNASGKGKCFISVMLNRFRIYFSERAVEDFELQCGKYLHFYQLGNRWYFFQNDDNAGFRIVKDKNSLGIQNTPLVKMIAGSIGMKTGKRFTLAYTRSEMKGCRIIEIRTDSTFFRENQKPSKPGFQRTAYK